MSRQKIVAFVALGLVALAVFFLAINSIPKAEPTTPVGIIKIELNPAKAPKTVENFLQYVDDKHYDGTIFHRVIPDFMIQGGGYNQMLSEKRTRGGIKNEAKNGLRNERGTIAMARTTAPDTATAQFFINVDDKNKFKLDPDFSDGHGYCVFGKVIDGMDIVDRIRASITMKKPPAFEALPIQDMVIKSARRDESAPKDGPPVVILEIEQSPTKRR